MVGDRIIVIGGLGARVWSCKEVYSLQVDGANSWRWAEHTHEVRCMDMPSEACLLTCHSGELRSVAAEQAAVQVAS